MQVERLIEIVRAKLDEPESSYLSDQMIVDWLNEAQRQLARDTRFYRDSYTFQTIAGEEGYEVPNLLQVDYVVYDPSGSPRLLQHLSMGETELNYSLLSSSGTPIYWTRISPIGIRLLPVPDTNFVTVEVVGFFIPDDMYYDENNPENCVDPLVPDSYLDALVAWVRHNFAAMEDDYNQAAYWLDVYQRCIRSIKTDQHFGSYPEKIVPRYL